MYRLVDIIADTLPDNHPWKGNVYGLVEKLVERGVTIQQWISVKDRLPKCEGSYIVYTETGSIYSSHFYTEKRFASGYVREAQWSKRGTVKVTHWMPLPQPPKSNNR